MDITLVDENNNEVFSGEYVYLEGEKDLDAKPVVYALVEDKNGNELKLFFKPKSEKEFNDFKEDLKQVMRH
jgi:hypothetical protein